MKETITNQVEDLSFEHATHDRIYENCSSCWTEKLVFKATKNRMSWEQNPDSLFSEGEQSKYLGRRPLPGDDE